MKSRRTGEMTGVDKQQEFVLRTLEERDIRFVRLWFTDVLGVLKSVAVAPAELEGAFAEGIGFDGSAIEGFARIYEADMLAKPDPSTFQVLPWRGESPGTGRMFCDITMPDGSPSPADPRWVLRRALSRAADRRLHVLHPPRGRVLPAQRSSGAPARGVPHPVDDGGYFDLTPHDVTHDFRRDAITMLERMGISVEFSHHEVAPGQQEIDLRYADALTTADNLMTFRLVMKEVALEQGVYATFMPKPFTDQPGSGMHTHVSLFEGDRNAFHDARRPDASVEGRQGIRRRAADALRRDHRRHQPVGQLLQAPDHRGRGAVVRVLGAQQPQRAGTRADVQAEQAERHPRRDPARPTRPAIRTSPSPCCSPPGSRASKRGTSCRQVPSTT